MAKGVIETQNILSSIAKDNELSSFNMDAIAEKPIAAIKEAPAFVKGIYYDSPDGRAAVESINSQIQTNLDKAESLKKQLADLDVLHNKVDSQLQQASKLHSEWLEVEKQMYKSLQPFSIPAVENKLRLAAQEAGSLSSTLAETFLEGSNETGDANDIGAFIRNYRAERKAILPSERKTGEVQGEPSVMSSYSSVSL